jgi:predicted transposase YdaD
VIYQDILGKGRVEGRVRGRLENARQDLIDVGTKRLGPPSQSERNVIEECADADRLKRMLLAAVDAPNWATVLASE